MIRISPATVDRLDALLRQMNACAAQLEELTQAEYEAIRGMDGEQVLTLADRRVACHQQFGQLEQACRELIRREGLPPDMSLEAVIDLYAGGPQTRTRVQELQALRRNLYERILHVDRQSQENRLRMHAAYNVSATILQHLGLSQPSQTYSPGAGR